MKVYIGNDHRGRDLSAKISIYLSEKGYKTQMLGTFDKERIDDPVFAKKVCEKVVDGNKNEKRSRVFGILVCGSGMGMSMASNRFKGIRCALCRSEEDAEMSRLHNDANVLALGADFTDDDIVMNIVSKFLDAYFLGGSVYRRRNDMLDL